MRPWGRVLVGRPTCGWWDATAFPLNTSLKEMGGRACGAALSGSKSSSVDGEKSSQPGSSLTEGHAELPSPDLKGAAKGLRVDGGAGVAGCGEGAGEVGFCSGEEGSGREMEDLDGEVESGGCTDGESSCSILPERQYPNSLEIDLSLEKHNS